MRWIIPIFSCGLGLAAMAQVRPFDFDLLMQNKHGLASETSVSATHAAALLPVGTASSSGKVRTWQWSGGNWVPAGFFNPPATALAVYQNQLALGLPGRIELRLHGSGGWGGPVVLNLPNAGDLPRRIEWSPFVLAVLTRSAGLDGEVVHLFERADDTQLAFAFSRTLTRGGLPSRVESIGLSGNRLAIGGGGSIAIHAINEGGASAWGVQEEVQAAGIDGFGSQGLALNPYALAVPGRDGQTGLPVVRMFLRQISRPNQWDDVGNLAVPAAQVSSFEVASDGSGRLAVLGWPPVSADVPPLVHGVAQLWFFSTPASGGFTEEARYDAGEIFGNFGIGGAAPPQRPRVVSIGSFGTTARALLGMPEEDPAGGRVWSIGSFASSGTAWARNAQLQGGGGPVNLGRSVAMSGRWLVAGMPRDFIAGPLSGSALVWRWRGGPTGQHWVPVAFLMKDAPVSGDEFGTAVDIHEEPDGDGAVAIVGAPGENGARGAAYLFEVRAAASGSSGPLRLVPPSQAAGDRFGQAVAIGTENTLLGAPGWVAAVGAPGNDGFSANGGSVTVFTRPPDTLGGPGVWAYTTGLFPPPFVAGSQRYGLGSTVDLQRDVIVAGIPGSYLGSTGPAGVAVYQKISGSWTSSEVIDRPGGAPEGFGAAVSLGPFRQLAIGAPGGSGQNGRVYLHHPPATPGAAMAAAQTLGGSATYGWSFGSAVAMDFENLLVGAPDTGARGSLWLFGPASVPPAGLAAGQPLVELASWTGIGNGSKLGSAVAMFAYTGVAGDPTPFGGADATGHLKAFRAGDYERHATAFPPESWLPHQDADGDGASNLLEWAMGSDALAAGSRPVFSMVPAVTDLRDEWLPISSFYPSMRYDVPSVPWRTLLLDRKFLFSENLASWREIEPTGSNASELHFERTGPRGFYRQRPQYPGGL